MSTNAWTDHQVAPLESLLDEAERSFWSSETRDGAFAEFLSRLSQYRRSDPDHWPSAITQCRRHGLFQFFQTDPYTRRCLRKPRGYAGDAVMLDYIYTGEPGPVDEVGRAAFSLTHGSTMSQSTRHRRGTFASLIDEVASLLDRPRVASIGAGHLREADVSRAIRGGELGELVAFDLDDMSLAVVRRDHGRLGVTTHKGAIADLVKGRLDLGSFDFIYSATVVDSLPDPMAHRLMSTLSQLLRPGGRLTIANCVTGHDGDAYHEAFMDWFLIYRSIEDLPRLADQIPTGAAGEVRSWVDPWGNVAYLDLVDVDASRSTN